MSIDKVGKMEEVLIEELLDRRVMDLYSAEKRIVQELPKLAEAVSDQDLREA